MSGRLFLRKISDMLLKKEVILITEVPNFGKIFSLPLPIF